MNMSRYIVYFTMFFFSVIWGQDCVDSVEVELWGECFNINETIELNYSYIPLGELSSRIGELTNLNYIHISDCGISQSKKMTLVR